MVDMTVEYSKTCVNLPLSKKPKLGFPDQLSLNTGQGEHSAILSTFIKLPYVIKSFVLSNFEWPFYTCFTVQKHQFYAGVTYIFSHI